MPQLLCFKKGNVCCALIPGLGKQRQVNLWDTVASHPTFLMSSRPGRDPAKREKKGEKVISAWRTTPEAVLWHTCMHACTHAHTHACTPCPPPLLPPCMTASSLSHSPWLESPAMWWYSQKIDTRSCLTPGSQSSRQWSKQACFLYKVPNWRHVIMAGSGLR